MKRINKVEDSTKTTYTYKIDNKAEKIRVWQAVLAGRMFKGHAGADAGYNAITKQYELNVTFAK